MKCSLAAAATAEPETAAVAAAVAGWTWHAVVACHVVLAWRVANAEPAYPTIHTQGWLC